MIKDKQLSQATLSAKAICMAFLNAVKETSKDQEAYDSAMNSLGGFTINHIQCMKDNFEIVRDVMEQALEDIKRFE